LRRNIGYKLLALAIAIIIWFYANEGQNPRASVELRRLPLVVREIEPDCVVAAAPKTVNVRLEGARAYINSVTDRPDTITAYVDLAGRTAGRYTVPVIVTPPAGFAGLVSATPVPREVSVVLKEKAPQDTTEHRNSEDSH